jgi:hypothetical protein
MGVRDRMAQEAFPERGKETMQLASRPRQNKRRG